MVVHYNNKRVKEIILPEKDIYSVVLKVKKKL